MGSVMTSSTSDFTCWNYQVTRFVVPAAKREILLEANFSCRQFQLREMLVLVT